MKMVMLMIHVRKRSSWDWGIENVCFVDLSCAHLKPYDYFL
jgi:hypothetical protein